MSAPGRAGQLARRPRSRPLPTHDRHYTPQLFYSFFKKLVGKEVAVELKNDVELTGKLHSVDQYLNIKLEDVQVVKKERYPQLVRDLIECIALCI